MDKLQQLQGAWRFIFEEAPLDEQTPWWVFRGERVIEVGKTPREGRCQLIGNQVRVTFPDRYGDVVVTLRLTDAVGTPGSAIACDYLEPFENFELSSHCVLLREPPDHGGGEPDFEVEGDPLPLAA